MGAIHIVKKEAVRREYDDAPVFKYSLTPAVEVTREGADVPNPPYRFSVMDNEAGESVEGWVDWKAIEDQLNNYVLQSHRDYAYQHGIGFGEEEEAIFIAEHVAFKIGEALRTSGGGFMQCDKSVRSVIRMGLESAGLQSDDNALLELYLGRMHGNGLHTADDVNAFAGELIEGKSPWGNVGFEEPEVVDVFRLSDEDLSLMVNHENYAIEELDYYPDQPPYVPDDIQDENLDVLNAVMIQKMFNERTIGIGEQVKNSIDMLAVLDEDDRLIMHDTSIMEILEARFPTNITWEVGNLDDEVEAVVAFHPGDISFGKRDPGAFYSGGEEPYVYDNLFFDREKNILLPVEEMPEAARNVLTIYGMTPEAFHDAIESSISKHGVSLSSFLEESTKYYNGLSGVLSAKEQLATTLLFEDQEHFGFDELVFLTRMNPEDLRKINAGEVGEITIPADTVSGFFDAMNGAGATLEIDIVEPLTISLKDGVRALAYIEGYNPEGHSPDEVYGLSGSAYQHGAGMELTPKVATGAELDHGGGQDVAVKRPASPSM